MRLLLEAGNFMRLRSNVFQNKQFQNTLSYVAAFFEEAQNLIYIPKMQ